MWSKTTPLGLGGGHVWSGKNCGRTTTAQLRNKLKPTSLGLGGGRVCMVKRIQTRHSKKRICGNRTKTQCSGRPNKMHVSRQSARHTTANGVGCGRELSGIQPWNIFDGPCCSERPRKHVKGASWATPGSSFLSKWTQSDFKVNVMANVGSQEHHKQ